MVMVIVVINFRSAEGRSGVGEVLVRTNALSREGLEFYALGSGVASCRRLVPIRRTNVATCGLA